MPSGRVTGRPLHLLAVRFVMRAACLVVDLVLSRCYVELDVCWYVHVCVCVCASVCVCVKERKRVRIDGEN